MPCVKFSKHSALFLIFALPATSSFAIDSAKDLRAARSSPIAQGAVVYKDNCVACHGEAGQAADQSVSLNKINKQLTLEKIKNGNDQNHAFLDKLSEDQIDQVAYYVSVIDDAVKRGEGVFMGKCTLCHGVKGDGTGRASAMHNPPPANLTISDKNDDYKRLIITYGGEYMGRNPAMPVWGTELSKQQIEDVIKYTNSIRVRPLDTAELAEDTK